MNKMLQTAIASVLISGSLAGTAIAAEIAVNPFTPAFGAPQMAAPQMPEAPKFEPIRPDFEAMRSVKDAESAKAFFAAQQAKMEERMKLMQEKMEERMAAARAQVEKLAPISMDKEAFEKQAKARLETMKQHMEAFQAKHMPAMTDAEKELRADAEAVRAAMQKGPEAIKALMAKKQEAAKARFEKMRAEAESRMPEMKMPGMSDEARKMMEQAKAKAEAFRQAASAGPEATRKLVEEMQAEADAKIETLKAEMEAKMKAETARIEAFVKAEMERVEAHQKALDEYQRSLMTKVAVPAKS